MSFHIYKYPENESTLRIKSEPVEKGDIESFKLASQMREILTDPSIGGCGLAAIQLGIPKKIIVFYHGSELITMYNPRISASGNKLFSLNESCLSIDNVSAFIPRKRDITVFYRDEKWVLYKKIFNGRSSVIIQHEIDHTNGILFIDRIKK